MTSYSYSEYSIFKSGAPHGSVLGPLLFLIYINDLESNIKSNKKFFADDTMLFSSLHRYEQLHPIHDTQEIKHLFQGLTTYPRQLRIHTQLKKPSGMY